MLAVMARNWWMLLIRGIAAIIFGILAFLNPQDAILALVLVFGVYALVDGVVAIVSGFRGRDTNRNWWATVLEGVVGAIAGIVSILMPDLVAGVLLFVIAVWAIVTGIFEIIAAIQLRKEIEGEFWMGLSGLASIIFGILLIILPGPGILALLWLIAAYAIGFGVVMIILAFRLKSHADRPAQPTQTRTA